MKFSLFKMYRSIMYWQRNHPRWRKKRLTEAVVADVRHEFNRTNAELYCAVDSPEYLVLWHYADSLIDLLDLIKK